MAWFKETYHCVLVWTHTIITTSKQHNKSTSNQSTNQTIHKTQPLTRDVDVDLAVVLLLDLSVGLGLLELEAQFGQHVHQPLERVDLVLADNPGGEEREEKSKTCILGGNHIELTKIATR